jgi:hypothetical protein
MIRPIRTLTLTVLLAAALAAGAQTPSQSAASGNPAARGERGSFYFNSMRGSAPNAPLQNGREAIRRPGANYGPVTPVPEPSEWAMLVVGLAFVGWIVRRKTRQ